jgi:hypothetical protein
MDMEKLSALSEVIPPEAKRKLARLGLKVGKQSPHILFGAGLVGFGATVVLASRATRKVEDVLEEHQTVATDIAVAREFYPWKYSEEARVRDLTILYTRTGLNLVRLYWPAAVVGTMSVLCLTKSHQILTSRNAALTAAYAALDKAFRDYRAGIADIIGKDSEEGYMRDARKVEVKNKETGKVLEETTTQGNKPYSPYAKFFDEQNKHWTSNPEWNLIFLRAQQNYANDRLRATGHVFLNEVYDWLGLPRTTAGSVVGWVLDGEGDDYIDFGLWDRDRDRVRAFINGNENVILLDFNVDGLIYDKIE